MKVTIDNVEYTETTPVTDHNLNKKTGEQINLRIEYDSNGEVVDGNFSVKLQDLILVYSTINDATYVPDESVLASLKVFNVVKENAISDIDVDFSVAPATGTYIRQGTENDSYPIYYYRGAVENNNLKFAGFCWKIVRTTETGGIKLIYNGVPTVEGTCNNTGEASQLTNISAFNSNYTSPADVGYMYGTRYERSSKSLSSQTDTYIYGNDVTWDGTNYTLVDTIESSNWENDRTNLATRYHYTCFSTTNTCTSVYYIYSFALKHSPKPGEFSEPGYLTLTDGNDIEDAKEAIFTNTTDSIIKTVIDNWYLRNMIGYTSMLEDTVWCNERDFFDGSLKSKNNGDGYMNSPFGAYGRNIINFVPNLSCPNKRDSFTVDGAIGNGKLTYPVGLLTADEITLAGTGYSDNTYNSYLNIDMNWFSMSPFDFSKKNSTVFFVHRDELSDTNVDSSFGVRPSVSLRAGTKISGGDGSTGDPYIVE